MTKKEIQKRLLESLELKVGDRIKVTQKNYVHTNKIFIIRDTDDKVKDEYDEHYYLELENSSSKKEMYSLSILVEKDWELVELSLKDKKHDVNFYLGRVIKFLGPDPTIIGYNMLKYAFKDGFYVLNAIRDTYREKNIYYIKPEDLHICIDNFKYLDGTKKKTVCLCEMWFEDIYISVPLDGYGKYWFLDKKEAEDYRDFTSKLKESYTIVPLKNGSSVNNDEQS